MSDTSESEDEIEEDQKKEKGSTTRRLRPWYYASVDLEENNYSIPITSPTTTQQSQSQPPASLTYGGSVQELIRKYSLEEEEEEEKEKEKTAETKERRTKREKEKENEDESEGGLLVLPSELSYFNNKFRWIEGLNRLTDDLQGDLEGHSARVSLLRQVAAFEAEFVRTATLYGKIIISERFLPVELKTIKPLDIGGIAGGVKVSPHPLTLP